MAWHVRWQIASYAMPVREPNAPYAMPVREPNATYAMPVREPNASYAMPVREPNAPLRVALLSYPPPAPPGSSMRYISTMHRIARA
eukprot:3940541-Rhodomonas_salina.1